MQEEEKVNKVNGSKQNFFLRLLGVIGIVALISGGTAYLVKQKPEVLGLTKSQEQAQSEVDQLLAEVGNLIALPTDERPIVVTVSDSEKVKEQSFLKNAQNGDKVIIYTNARKTILYRPSERKIIEVGAVNIQQKSPEPIPVEGVEVSATATPTSTPTATVTPTPQASETP